jgi:hypothetical protein
MLLCQSSKFGGSNKGEIGRIKEKDRPALFADLVGQPEIAKFVGCGIVASKFKFGYFLPEFHCI